MRLNVIKINYYVHSTDIEYCWVEWEIGVSYADEKCIKSNFQIGKVAVEQAKETSKAKSTANGSGSEDNVRFR